MYLFPLDFFCNEKVHNRYRGELFLFVHCKEGCGGVGDLYLPLKVHEEDCVWENRIEVIGGQCWRKGEQFGPARPVGDNAKPTRQDDEEYENEGCAQVDSWNNLACNIDEYRHQNDEKSYKYDRHFLFFRSF